MATTFNAFTRAMIFHCNGVCRSDCERAVASQSPYKWQAILGAYAGLGAVISMVPHIVLEEIGAPYERQLVNLAQGEHKSDAYLNSWKSAGTCRRWHGTHGKRRHLDLSGKAIPGKTAVVRWHNRRSTLLINDGVVREHRSYDVCVCYPA